MYANDLYRHCGGGCGVLGWDMGGVDVGGMCLDMCLGCRVYSCGRCTVVCTDMRCCRVV